MLNENENDYIRKMMLNVPVGAIDETCIEEGTTVGN